MEIIVQKKKKKHVGGIGSAKFFLALLIKTVSTMGKFELFNFLGAVLRPIRSRITVESAYCDYSGAGNLR